MTTAADLAAADLAVADASIRTAACEAVQTWLRDCLIHPPSDPAATAAELLVEHGPWLPPRLYARLAELV
ncbi:hypothetical protein [Pseudofrankia inefficax]|uniref:Uncharacterized protein n=1 Tax=Pseudofrankia inefficax (strain DSM 45817 / CECT 9037 / DDB 130130 / EuI1c) TaxID=298654 RepID=E3J745_PSEI1|nr:hypothetical protein [Pseudofrankia inefficax]ADP84409.1 hypothetical protein FraEuI1c_6428 [Pseudofrankia inefficax]